MLKAIGSRFDLSDPRTSEYVAFVSDLLESDVVAKMKEYPHHGNTTCFQHCLNVSYYNYVICKLLSLNARAAARAGLLHDLFLYDWHTYVPAKGERLHGFTHASTALTNVRRHFEITPLESDIIETHMFPLTTALPRYKETVVIVMVDKLCGAMEVISGFKYTLAGFLRMNRRERSDL